MSKKKEAVTLALTAKAVEDLQELSKRHGKAPEAVVDWLVRRQAAQERLEQQIEKAGREAIASGYEDADLPPSNTELGRRLRELRAEARARGERLLSWEELEREMAERRGGVEARAE